MAYQKIELEAPCLDYQIGDLRSALNKSELFSFWNNGVVDALDSKPGVYCLGEYEEWGAAQNEAIADISVDYPGVLFSITVNDSNGQYRIYIRDGKFQEEAPNYGGPDELAWKPCSGKIENIENIEDKDGENG